LHCALAALNVVNIMMASRQLLGVARSRAVGSASLGLRRMATVTDSPLDKKVSSMFNNRSRAAALLPRRGSPARAMAG
jgi:hypothetical protein